MRFTIELFNVVKSMSEAAERDRKEIARLRTEMDVLVKGVTELRKWSDRQAQIQAGMRDR